MLHAAGREVGDGEGGLHTIHIQAKRYQRGLQESCHGTDHRMILEVLWGEGGRYVTAAIDRGGHTGRFN